MEKTVILCDLDGVLAYYDEWRGPLHIGAPIPAMVAKVRRVIQNGGTVRIFTARASDAKNIPVIKDWLKQNGLPDLKITNEKDFDATEIWDDRARRVIKNEGTFE